MKIVENPHQAYAHVDHWRSQESRVGLVPTMGALHEGHLRLVECSRDECDITAVTIFVNPTQFGPHEDFNRYPRTLVEDLDHLRTRQVDLVFLPKQEDLYPTGFSTYIHPPTVAEPLEGVFRPGHFRGVATIVMKLFQILPAHVAYFGQKDFQQLTVIRRMVEDLNVPMRIASCETVREPDGLAMSSRNRYLAPEQRSAALGLWTTLRGVVELIADGTRGVEDLEQYMHRRLVESGVDRIDYARIVDRYTLESLTQVDRPAVALIAAHIGSTRLIDNTLLE